MKARLPALHIVTNDAILRRSDFLAVAVDLLVVLQRRIALHVRGPGMGGAELFAIVNALAAKAEYVGVPLVLNDRLDIALAFDAAGVQLGARSLPVAAARGLLPRARRIGYSAHGSAEAAAAEQDGADFIFAGTIYETPSHPAATPTGIAALAACVEACSVPVLAIGGVNAERVGEVISTGAYGVAVISAVWSERDPVQAAERIARMLET